MHSRVTGLPQLAVAGTIAILAAGVSGCSSSSSSATGAGSTQPAAMSPSQAIQLAANETRDVNSFAATVDIQASGKPGSSFANVQMAGTLQEQVHPSLLASADFGTFSAGAQSLPGGMDEIITPQAVYLKASMLTQAMHSAKPWVEMQLSELSKATGLNLGSLISQMQTSSPLTQTQLLAGATDVRTAGTGTVDGVPVTEYAGTYSMSAALAKLAADTRGPISQAMRKAGFSRAQFQVWIDGQHLPRKEIITEDGSMLTETITVTVSSINQPASISVPAASQTTTLPASAFNSMG